GALLPDGSRLAATPMRRFTAPSPAARTAPAGSSSSRICRSAMAAPRFGHGSISASACNIRTGPNLTGPPRTSMAWGETRAATIRSLHSGLCSEHRSRAHHLPPTLDVFWTKVGLEVVRRRHQCAHEVPDQGSAAHCEILAAIALLLPISRHSPSRQTGGG